MIWLPVPYFDEVLRIDYQTIYSTYFIDEVAFPDNKEDSIVNIKPRRFDTAGYDRLINLKGLKERLKG